MVLKIRKSDGFRELYENKPEITAPRLETSIRYLWHHVWWACFHDQKRFWGFREIIEFVSKIFWSLLTSRCLKEMNTLVCGAEMSMKVRTIGIRQRFGQNKLEWNRQDKMAYDINNKSIDHMDWWAFPNMLKSYSSKISNKINEYMLSSSVCLVLFCKLRWCAQFPYRQHEKPM